MRSLLNLPFRHLAAWTAPLLIALSSCEEPKGQQVVDAAIEAHGGEAYESFVLEFDFRDIHYTAARNGGIFRYTRTFDDSTGRIEDVLSNDGFTRFRNGSPVTLSAGREGAFRRSVNSVIYFALLPFGLNDKSVNKEWLGETKIEGKPYDLVRVTFDQSGGEDHQDTFLYWFHRDHHTMDYLAYSYETDGGGMRFREAVNRRQVGGILLQDYINYKPSAKGTPLGELQAAFADDRLERLSEVRLENVTVSEYAEDN